MAVRTKEEIMGIIKERIGDSTSDEDLSFVEDINDTFDDYERRTSGQEDWRKKYEDNDRTWREKYKERFFRGDENDRREERVEETEETKEEITSYEDLFKEES